MDVVLVQRKTRPAPWLLLPLLVALAGSATAHVESLELHGREPVLGGVAFGDGGPYEKIVGRLYFSYAPDDPANASIVDLQRVPVGADGRVETAADFVVLRPVDPERSRGTALVEVSNRGGKASLSYFNRARSSRDPVLPEHFGDGLLMRLGLTVVWVGWQFDVPPEPGRLRLYAPLAQGPEGPLTGLVRCDWTLDAPAQTLPLGHREHVPYDVHDREDPANVLTARAGRLAPRRVVPRDRWRFVGAEDTGRGDADERGGTFSAIALDAGFEPGLIYELVYRARDPTVVGLGLAAIRDTMAWLKDGERCPFAVERGVAVGISQTGRFLRHFLYQGFNSDEHGHRAFDGMLIHSAGAGRGSFNHRFAQPSRDAHRYSAFFYPTDLFPFSGRTQSDPVTGRSDGLLTRAIAAGHAPKLVYTNTAYEYWGRAASLLHTTPDGETDVELLPNERLYHFAGGQHFVSEFPPADGARLPAARAWRGNPLDFLLTERALLVDLLDWVEDDTAPPASRYPRIDDGTLVPVEALGLVHIPGVEAPRVIHEAYRANYGERWDQGIVDVQPPALGPAFPSLVCRLDGSGNELAGTPSIELLVPVASYLPWHLRAGLAGGNGELTDFFGTIAPLPRTEEQRQAGGDERPSLESLYASKADYMTRARGAARDLVAQRFLLEEDVAAALQRAEALYDWAASP